MMGRVSEIGVFETSNQCEKWVETLTEVEQDFSSYFANFRPFLMIFQSSAAHSTLKNHQKWQKFGKKMEKSLV